MKILLFGGSGQLGHEIIKRGHDLNFEVVSPVISELDIADRGQVMFLTAELKPDLIISAAAYTSVDQAEEEISRAYATNRDGAANIAWAAEKTGARLIHISTDYVFDGAQSKPLKEDAKTNPLNVYGSSKLAGERSVQGVLGDAALIIRTSGLHGRRGNNFVNAMIQLFNEQETVPVVSDQFMSPTWAGWLGEVVLDLSRIKCGGIVHACSDGAISWFDFAAAILEIVKPKLPKGHEVKLLPVSAREFPRAARRPMYSVMDTSRLTNLLGRKPIGWRDGLRAHLAELGYEV